MQAVLTMARAKQCMLSHLLHELDLTFGERIAITIAMAVTDIFDEQKSSSQLTSCCKASVYHEGCEWCMN